MTPRDRLGSFSVGALAALCTLACDRAEPVVAPPPAAAEPPARPDIVLVSIDSLRHDHLGCYGYPKPTSPTLDRLAREGTRFETAVSTTSWTLPAHAAMFTGLFDSAHGLVDNGLVLDEGHRTLAEVLRAAGYHTAGFFGGPYLHPAYGLAQGFERYQSCMTELEDGASDAAVHKFTMSPASGAHRDVTGPRTLEEVERWLASIDARPFFLFLHLWDVHYDYIPPPEYVRMFDPDYAGALDASGLPRNPAVNPKMDPRDREHLIALYDGEIRFTDDHIGKILAALDARGRLAKALVVVTADHGQEFFEHGGKGHQRSLYDEVVRVPLIVRWPEHVTPGRIVRDQVSLVDLLPTIAALAGVEAPPVQGRDLGPLLRGETLAPAPALCELTVAERNMRALRRDAFKLIASTTSKKGPQTLGFDLTADPRELQPLEASDPRIGAASADLEGLRSGSQTWRAKSGAGSSRFQVEPTLQRRLDALGYTGDDR